MNSEIKVRRLSSLISQSDARWRLSTELSGVINDKHNTSEMPIG